MEEKKIKKSVFSSVPKPIGSEIVAIKQNDSNDPNHCPVIVTPHLNNVVLSEWIKNNKPLIDDYLCKHGAILFRGFNIHSIELFKEFSDSYNPQNMEYTQRSSPRTEIKDSIYNSTEHPADQEINMHNELSYAAVWPLKIIFCCIIPAESGGETPIADSRKVFNDLTEEVKLKFADKGVLYIRNLNEQLGLKWQDVFQTTDPVQVEQYCHENGIEYIWKSKEQLILKWRRKAVEKHPLTGEMIWFNHSLFFNSNSLDPIVKNTLSKDQLPFDTFYGDGSAIDIDTLAVIASAFDRNKKIFNWEKGDVLLLDNMLMAHGRNPYKGDRKIVVSMLEPCNS